MPAPEDELERRLDAALRAYTDSVEGPSPAMLAARVLAASAEKTPRVRQLMPYGLLGAAACALCLVLALLNFTRREPTPPLPHLPPASLAASGALPQAKSAPLAMLRAAAHHHGSVVPEANAAPKLDRFPQPRPLSEQEKLMVAFVTSASPAEQRAAAKAARIPPYQQIAELEVQPIGASISKTENSGAPHEQHR